MSWTIEQFDEENLALDCPYDKSFLDDFRELIPGRDRTWDPHLKMWFVKDKYEVELMRLLDMHFGGGR